MRLGLIWAQANGRVIGNEGKLPWHLPEDLQNFAIVTGGCPVIMGRRTWDSLPESRRPLPGRYNIVLSRQRVWTRDDMEPIVLPDVTVRSILDALVEANRQTDDIAWVIGGEQIYKEALPYADTAIVTNVYTDVEGDAFAPELGDNWALNDWTPVRWSSTGLRYRIAQFDRIRSVY
jgi:dihydrofolate reductase